MNYSKLKSDIERHKMPVRQLCFKLGITNATYYNFMKKENMYLNIFEKICQMLKLNPLDYFELQHINYKKNAFTVNEKFEIIKSMVSDLSQEYETKKE